jgi:hypothetical protein
LQKIKNFEKDYLGAFDKHFFRRQRAGDGLYAKVFPAKKNQDLPKEST